MLLFAAMLVFFTSCGDETDNDETDGADTTSSVTPATTADSPAVAEPSNIMLVKHRVASFAKWKPSYDAHDSLRQANGIHSFVIGRGIEDSNMVLVATKVDDVAKAKEFGKSPALKKAMQESGVRGTPSFMMVRVPVLRTTSSSDLRVISTFTVKDWDTWKSAFESGKQLRMENGIEDRGYGHDVDDNHKVVVVAAVVDSAKVRAFHKSDTLQSRMKASGMVGKPDRFWYRVVQTY